MLRRRTLCARIAACGALVAVAACGSAPARRVETATHRPVWSDTWYECRDIDEQALAAAALAPVERACADERASARDRASARRRAERERTAKPIEPCACTRLVFALQGRKRYRRALEAALLACEDGSQTACDHFTLVHVICLRNPDHEVCDLLREIHGIPTEDLPVSRLIGCWRRGGQVICTAYDTLFLRDEGGTWDAGRISSWDRDDSPKEARRSLETPYGQIVLTPRRIVESPCVETEPARDPIAEIDPSAGAPTKCRRWLVAPGPLEPIAEPDLARVRRALAALPTIDAECARVDSCVHAIDEQLAPPARDEPGSSEMAWEPAVPLLPESSRTLRACRAYADSAIAELRRRAPGAAAPEACRFAQR